MAGEWGSACINAVADVTDYVANGSFESLRENVTYKNKPDYAVLVRLVDHNAGWKGDFVYVDKASYDFLRKSSLKQGDIVIANVGANAGTVFRVPDLDTPMTLGPNAVLCRPKDEKELLRDFLYYYLVSEAGQHSLRSILSGSAQPKFNKTDFRRLEVPVPTLPEQRAIAHILGTLDDKIELNRRMNETLEAMARALFKSWFVDFDPVRAKAEGRDPGLPKHIADLFPDSFEDSELGEIPKGWRVGVLNDVAEHPRRGIQPNEIKPTTPYIALEHMPRRCIALAEWNIADGLESNKFEFKKGEILFGKLRPYFHKVGVAPVDGVCSTDIVVVTPRTQEWFGFILGHVSSDTFVEYTNAGSTGTKMPRTSWSDMARYAMVIPPDNIAKAYSSQVRPAVDRITASIHESRTLAAERDSLLPKLISGELRVRDSETAMARVDVFTPPSGLASSRVQK
ncbi:MAG TPA: restriction endonuclease subunit S [Candidatus Acidoferrales bacterium]|nr:restriction endonuclease subunit S [Candidatus Acidoferrales bacterium]